jgi:hypothetical protein
MYNFYVESFTVAKRQLEFAKVGYMQQVNNLGFKIAQSDVTEEEVSQAIDALIEARAAIADLQDTVDRNERYVKEEERKAEEAKNDVCNS